MPKIEHMINRMRAGTAFERVLPQILTADIGDAGLSTHAGVLSVTYSNRRVDHHHMSLYTPKISLVMLGTVQYSGLFT